MEAEQLEKVISRIPVLLHVELVGCSDPVVLTFGRQEFKTSLGYIARPYLQGGEWWRGEERRVPQNLGGFWRIH